MTTPHRIDTHQHIIPPAYAEWFARQGITAGGLPLPAWSADAALDLMDSADIACALLSVSTPGVHTGDDLAARALAREVNDFAASVVTRHPGRFGFFATLTLPDVDGALAEAAYALDHLNADGVVLLTNVGNCYFGDAAWEPLMAELNRRKTVVFIHPCDLPGPSVPGIPPFAADFLLNTTRAAINYAKSGALERYPDLKIILSHGGGFVPYAAERIARICAADGSNAAGLARLRQFYFDTALTSSPYALPSLLAFANPSHITFGSDWPYAPKARSLHFSKLLDAFELTDGQRQAIDQGNASRLFARFTPI